MKIVTIVGARPQFIKAAVVSRAILCGYPDFTEVLVHTGQHYDKNMSEIFFKELNIPEPLYNLEIGGGSHGQNTGRMLEKIEEVLLKEKPDWVLIYGDTDSTLAGALAAAKLNIRVAHIEAGLRSFNRKMPEEINRILTDHISTLLFAPTQTAKTNLLNEGISSALIHIVGDVMYDAALFYKPKAKEPKSFAELCLNVSEFILCTIHRAENTDNYIKMKGIIQGLGECGLPIIIPLHPRTKKKLDSQSIIFPENIYIIEPVSYLEMVWLEQNSSIIVTDSGGVQKEAYFHQKPCITIRDETEWVELVTSGYNEIVGSDPIKIIDAISRAKSKVLGSEQLYGDGYSGIKILDLLIS